MIALEKEGYIDCKDVRNPVLTPIGHQEAVRYSNRIDITLNHLLWLWEYKILFYFEDLLYNRIDNVRRDSKKFRDKDFWKTVDFCKI